MKEWRTILKNARKHLTEQRGCLLTSSKADICRDISQQRHSSTSPSRWGGSGALPSTARQYGNTAGRVKVSFSPKISFPISVPGDAPRLQTFSTCFHATEQLFWAQPAPSCLYLRGWDENYLQPPASYFWSSPAHVLLFCFDLVAISSYRELHKIQSHMLGLGQVVSQMGAEPHCL